jgi:hypothetical protein
MEHSRKKTVHLGSDKPAHETMPGVHRVASLLKRWLLGTYQGAVQPKQLYYMPMHLAQVTLSLWETTTN